MKEAVLERPKGKVWTYEDYLSGRIPREVSEVIDGKEVRKMPAGAFHGWLEGIIFARLFEKLQRQYLVLVGEVALLLSRTPLHLRGADIVVVSKERLKSPPEGAIGIPPDLVVEIASPDDTLPYILRKMNDYKAWGVKRQVWILPKDREVVVITPEGLKTYSGDEEVELLGGVKFKLNALLKKVE
ncbi:MAG: Uma2 family endonuclease [Thermotogae bacterium]|nr:Uma2 family endonuclease [Thermotogota bacterium]